MRPCNDQWLVTALLGVLLASIGAPSALGQVQVNGRAFGQTINGSADRSAYTTARPPARRAYRDVYAPPSEARSPSGTPVNPSDSVEPPVVSAAVFEPIIDQSVQSLLLSSTLAGLADPYLGVIHDPLRCTLSCCNREVRRRTYNETFHAATAQTGSYAPYVSQAVISVNNQRDRRIVTTGATRDYVETEDWGIDPWYSRVYSVPLYNDWCGDRYRPYYGVWGWSYGWYGYRGSRPYYRTHRSYYSYPRIRYRSRRGYGSGCNDFYYRNTGTRIRYRSGRGWSFHIRF